MKKAVDQSRSVWMDTSKLLLESKLTEKTTSDVCVVGAGVAGMSTAYVLAREGMSVVVLDDGPIGGGMTARTTAHLTNALDNRYFEIERLHGKEGARVAAASHTAAINAIEAIVKREAIRCEFARLDGFLFVPPRASTKVLDDELAAVHRAGLTDIEKVGCVGPRIQAQEPLTPSCIRAASSAPLQWRRAFGSTGGTHKTPAIKAWFARNPRFHVHFTPT